MGKELFEACSGKKQSHRSVALAEFFTQYHKGKTEKKHNALYIVYKLDKVY